MTIQELGSLGELVAAVATIATLIYLALQVRGSAAATRAEARRSADTDGNETIRKIAGDPDLTRIFTQRLAEPDRLSPEDAFRFRLLMSHFFFMQDTAWKEVRVGTLSRQQLAESVERSRPFFETRGGRTWWHQNADVFFEENFRAYFEAQVPKLSIPRSGGGSSNPETAA